MNQEQMRKSARQSKLSKVKTFDQFKAEGAQETQVNSSVLHLNLLPGGLNEIQATLVMLCFFSYMEHAQFSFIQRTSELSINRGSDLCSHQQYFSRGQSRWNLESSKRSGDNFYAKITSMVFVLKFTYFCPQCDIFRECTDKICIFFFYILWFVMASQVRLLDLAGEKVCCSFIFHSNIP